MNKFFKILAFLFDPQKHRENKTVFRYKYQRYPFDEAQYFTVEANTEDEADKIATDKFTEMFNSGHTVMIRFYPG